jgi:hypothetical protein
MYIYSNLPRKAKAAEEKGALYELICETVVGEIKGSVPMFDVD